MLYLTLPLRYQVYRLSSENLRGLAAKVLSEKGKTLLFGYMCTLTAIENAVWPVKKKVSETVKKWREQDGYDCVEFTRQGGMCRLVVFEPHALYATHCLGPLSRHELEKLASDMAAAVTTSLAPQFPTRHVPAGGDTPLVIGKQLTISMDVPPLPTHESTVPKIEELRGTWAEELKFEATWDGTNLELPGAQEKQERELLQKLSFANPQASPFAGIKLVETMLTQELSNASRGRLVCDLKLLRALELISKDEDAAKEQLEEYVTEHEKLGPACPTHPLALLAFSRVPYQSGDASIFLHTFAYRYPEAADRFLDANEKKQVQQRRIEHEADDNVDDQHGSRLDDPVQMWAELVHEQDAASAAMDGLLQLTGLRKVKLAAVRLFKTGLMFNQMDPETRAKNAPTLNYCFLGNPGTGKTSVARLFAKILHDSGLRKGSNFVESTAQELKEKGPDEFRARAKKAEDGVLFIDETYDLDPVGDKFKGAPVVNELMTTAENDRERLTIIIAGYEDEMNDKFFAYNPGLKSRFTEMVFEDFDEEELLQVWNSQRKERGWTEADSRLGKVVVRRLFKASCRKGFGNARAVRQRLEEATDRAMARPDFDPRVLKLEITDAVGENPAHSTKLAAVLAQIDKKIGWANIKRDVRQLVEVCKMNYERELDGLAPLDVFLNRMFLGNPGTGKTTCAKLYGQVLKHLGFLSNGDIVEKSASDLGGQAVGQAQQKTAKLLECCAGKVLLIDEAYALDKSQYGAQALDTIVEKVQNGGDIAVLLLGYTDEMLAMLRNQNPGLARRFDPSQAFNFEDYTEQELSQILQQNCKSKELKPSLDFQKQALKKLEEQRRSEPNFGNAGAVDNLVKSAVQSAMARGAAQDLGGALMRLEADDVELGPGADDDGDPFAPLDKLFRMDGVKKTLQSLHSRFKLAEDEGDARPSLGHFVFKGAPGTGKTTVARVAATILFRLKLIAKDVVIETTGSNSRGKPLARRREKSKSSSTRPRVACCSSTKVLLSPSSLLPWQAPPPPPPPPITIAPQHPSFIPSVSRHLKSMRRSPSPPQLRSVRARQKHVR